MTFYEAALRVMEAAGRPMHVEEITQQSIAQNLLSHVGKTPDQTMLSRLAAMARRSRDRRVIVTAKDTFALVDWAVPEDPEALALTGVPPPNTEESLPPLRPAERHPDPKPDNVRAGGRGVERKRRHGEDEELAGVRRRRFPPLAEAIFEVLSDAGQPLRLDEVLQRVQARELASEDLGADQLLRALAEDNQRRLDAGRRPQFVLSRESEELRIEHSGGASDLSSAEIQLPFAERLGLPIEAGRVVFVRGLLADSRSEEVSVARAALKDARRAVARNLRRKLLELEPRTFERAVVHCLKALSFHEIRVVKRSREGALLTARKRDGSAELRYTVRVLKNQTAVDRRAVHELRRDGGRYGAQLVLLASAADLRGEARTEVQSAGGLPVVLWCGEALAERFLDAKTAVSVTHVELFEIDERFFTVAQAEAEESQRRREERTRDRHRPQTPAVSAGSQSEDQAAVLPPNSTPGEPAANLRPDRPNPPGADAAESSAVETVGAEEAGDREEEDDSDFEDSEASDQSQEVAVVSGEELGASRSEVPQAPSGERPRRRRRRRGRRGRGRPQAAAAAAPAGLPQPTEPTPAVPPAASPSSPPLGGSDEK